MLGNDAINYRIVLKPMLCKDLSIVFFSTRFVLIGFLIALVGLLSAVGCNGPDQPPIPPKTAVAIPPGGVSYQKLEPGEKASAGQFQQLSGAETGLQFANQLDAPNMRKYLLNGAGLATGDFDNDGLVDVYAISQDGPNRLYRQTSPWQFADASFVPYRLDSQPTHRIGSRFVLRHGLFRSLHAEVAPCWSFEESARDVRNHYCLSLTFSASTSKRAGALAIDGGGPTEKESHLL